MIIKCCGHCTGTNIKDVRANGFTNSLIMHKEKITVSEPKLYYCFDCKRWSCEEDVYKIGELER